jgi:hypothetical protein
MDAGAVQPTGDKAAGGLSNEARPQTATALHVVICSTQDRDKAAQHTCVIFRD